MRRRHRSRPIGRGSAAIASGEELDSFGDDDSADVPETAASIRADRLLIERCLAGEVAAWEELYAQCHEPLRRSIKVLLGRQGSDGNLVDEIAARVWYALVENDGELLSRFDPARGARVMTFMGALAKDEICQHIRTEIRRRERELLSARAKGAGPDDDLAESVSSLREFLSTLTPGERSFCDEFLLASPSDKQRDAASAANIWQLTHRIYQKFLHFFGRQG